MSRYHIPFFAFLMLLLLTIPLLFGVSTSVIPGWHTAIFPPYHSIAVIVVVITLFMATIGYWLLAKRQHSINWIGFIIHFLCTVPAIAYIKRSHVMHWQVAFIFIAVLLFSTGQFLFVRTFLKASKLKTQPPNLC